MFPEVTGIRKHRIDSRGFKDKDLIEQAAEADRVKIHNSMSLNLMNTDKELASCLMPQSDLLTKGMVKLVNYFYAVGAQHSSVHQNLRMAVVLQ